MCLAIVDSLVGAPFSTLFSVAASGAKLRRNPIIYCAAYPSQLKQSGIPVEVFPMTWCYASR